VFLRKDSSGLLEKFFRSLARRVFIELSKDPRPCNEIDPAIPDDITVGEASSLLSAILFVDLSTERYGIESFAMNMHPPNAAASCDDFVNDNY
jgi:hypothetical protein